MMETVCRTLYTHITAVRDYSDEPIGAAFTRIVYHSHEEASILF